MTEVTLLTLLHMPVLNRSYTSLCNLSRAAKSFINSDLLFVPAATFASITTVIVAQISKETYNPQGKSLHAIIKSVIFLELYEKGPKSPFESLNIGNKIEKC